MRKSISPLRFTTVYPWPKITSFLPMNMPSTVNWWNGTSFRRCRLCHRYSLTIRTVASRAMPWISMTYLHLPIRSSVSMKTSGRSMPSVFSLFWWMSIRTRIPFSSELFSSLQRTISMSVWWATMPRVSMVSVVPISTISSISSRCIREPNYSSWNRITAARSASYRPPTVLSRRTSGRFPKMSIVVMTRANVLS